MPKQVLWVRDEDCCEMCNGLLDYFGQCPHCGWDSVYGYSVDDTDDEEDVWYDEYGDGDWRVYERGRVSPDHDRVGEENGSTEVR